MSVSIVIPCHNEEKTIQSTFNFIVKQTLKPSQVFFVNDLSSDNTFKELLKLKRNNKTEIKIKIFNTTKNLFRAGACNLALKHVNTDYVVIMDAGSLLEKHAVEYAIDYLSKEEKNGLVCSRAGLIKSSGLLYSLQKLEYANTDLSRMIFQNNVLISHGLFTAAKTKYLREVNFYSEGVLLEDYDLTVKMKLKGYKASFDPNIKAYTNSVDKIGSFQKQRFRWFLGGLDVLKKFGWNKATRIDYFGHILYFMFFFTIMGTLVFGANQFFSYGQFNNIMLLPISLSVINYVTSLLSLKFVEGCTKKDVLLKIIIFPELFYCVFQELIRWKAYLTFIFINDRRW